MRETDKQSNKMINTESEVILSSSTRIKSKKTYQKKLLRFISSSEAKLQSKLFRLPVFRSEQTLL